MLSPAQFEDIFCQIEAGATLLEILPALDPPLPRTTFLGWIAKEPALIDRYARAMAQRADAWAEKIAVVSKDDGRGSDHKRVETDALKWLAGKAAPKKYGDRLELGGDVTIRSKAVIDRAVAAARDADD